MSTDVELLRGDVTVRTEHHETALNALHRMDADLRRFQTLPGALAELNFIATLAPNGDIVGVELDESPMPQKDEKRYWSALAPYVDAGSVMDWLSETTAAWRWAFDGEALRVVPGRIVFTG